LQGREIVKFKSGRINLRRFVCYIGLFWLVGFAIAAEASEPGCWIAVTPSGLQKAVEPLCNYRRQEGFNVFVVQTEEICKSNDSPAINALAIKEYLQDKYAQLRGPVYVLLAGAVRSGGNDDANTLPTLAGQCGRMKNLPCDAGYGPADSEKAKTVTIGRLPARTSNELEQMVQKILRYEQSAPAGAWKYRLSIMAGNPGGQTLMQKNLSGMVIQMIGRDSLSRINPFWCVDGLIHAVGSDFYVPDGQLPSRAKSLLENGQAFSFYLGHSGPDFLRSEEVIFLDQKDWTNLKISNLQGVFFTCGCYAARLGDTGRFDGYALTAMRNPQGPAAVIAAYGESYAAIGHLAFGGMLDCLSRAKPPKRLGDYWQSVRDGIAAGFIEPMMFTLFDYADGSRGTTTLEFQRLEHLEMWMLLGDPAMQIPVPSGDVKFSVLKSNKSAGIVQIKGTVPAHFEGGLVQLTLEKTLRKPKELSVSEDGAFKEPWQGVTGYANNAYILDKTEVIAEKGGFSGELTLSEMASPAEILIRAYVKKDLQDAMRIEVLEIDRLVTE
jgi:hypothetical protein